MSLAVAQPKSNMISRGPCPKCRENGEDRSGDNLARYDDGHSYCYKCGFVEFLNDDDDDTKTVELVKPVKEFEMLGTHGPIKDRKISEAIVSKFGVTLETDSNGSISKHHYPYKDRDSGATVGTKVRNVPTKQFYATGTFNNTGLFGQSLWREGGKYVTVTEGEADALAIAEMFDGKWPVVSVKTGSAGAKGDIKENLEWLETFENVVICFDNDPAGRKATEEVLPLFSHNKVRSVSLPSNYKDAGDMLKSGKIREFTSAWWDAKPFRPVDVVPFSDERCWDEFIRRGTEEVTPLPTAFGTLNGMMNGGIAAGEVTVIGALTSVGKTTVVYNLLYGMKQESNKRIGVAFLESSLGETTEKLVSIHMGKNLSTMPTSEWAYDEFRKFYDDLKQDDKLHIHNHQGSDDLDELFSKIRYMAKGLDCDVVIIDPLQVAVTSNENGMIDAFMDRCLKLAKETSISIIVVSHMRKPQVKDAHDVNEYDMKGSGSINQIAFNTILLSRDKLSEDDYTRNSTKVQLVKCRRTGRTGTAGWLFYEQETSRLVQGNPPEIQAVSDEEF